MPTSAFHYTIDDDDDLDLEDTIACQVVEDEDLRNTVLTGISVHDMRASYVEDSFKVVSVDVLPDREVLVECEYEWEAYYGCRDMCRYGTESVTLRGRLVGDQLTVQVVWQEPRSSHDEL